MVELRKGLWGCLWKQKGKDGCRRFVQVIINKEGLTAKLFDIHLKYNKISENEEINKSATMVFLAHS